jgi:uncharacterized protein involved in exopolysaccharide biosynthesis
LGVIAGIGIALAQPILYEGVTTLMVTPPSARSSTPNFTAATLRALIENVGLVTETIAETGLSKPPYSFTPQTFLEEALGVEEVRNTNLVRVKVRVEDANLAATASRVLARKAIALNRRLGQDEGSAIQEQLKTHLDQAADRLKTAEEQLLRFQKAAQVDLLKEDANAMLDERGDLLKLTIQIESEKARLAAAEQEISKQERVLSVGRAIGAEAALRRTLADQEKPAPPPQPGAAPGTAAEGRQERDIAKGLPRRDTTATTSIDAGADSVDLTNPFINPVYQTLDFTIATSRARLAALERERRELVDVRKLGGEELQKLSELYSRQIELGRLQNAHDVAKRVYSDLLVRYEQSRTEALGNASQVQLVDEAAPPEKPLSRKRGQGAALGLVAGLFASALIALVLESRRAAVSQ